MFIGEYSHTIDAKGRLIVPSKFREQLGEEFVVTKGLDGCLFVYENSEWKSFEEKLHALPLTNANARKFTRFFLAGACACEVDRQGRILIPAVLREFAKLERMWFWWGWEAGLKSGTSPSGMRKMCMMIWTKSQRTWKDWAYDV